ncbi:hypothetical protein [Methylobacter sp. BlB1]|uniref:hypothetical protein n=1 Tax=Methylobacter sp. BlB1 TaxID=2785914 RepID=UPI001893AFC3|nr:hypothetical protein [Methylobacter sp. BlB1]MBF6650422.1 hypothetical protein [Methylobacter sp. BlB1]
MDIQIIFSDADNVNNQPQVDIVAWSIREVSFYGDDEDDDVMHLLIGFVMMNKQWRVTTAIQHFDSDRKKITTSSGRIYNLVGQPVSNGDTDFELVWQLWKMTNNVNLDVDVTDKYATKIKWFVM